MVLIFQTGDLVDILSSGHRCKQEPSAVAQFPLESRENINSSVYSQFTGVVDVILYGGKNYKVASSMEINQGNPFITTNSPTSAHHIANGFGALLTSRQRKVNKDSTVDNTFEPSGNESDSYESCDGEELSQTGERAVVPIQGNTFPAYNPAQPAGPAAARCDITGDTFHPTTVVSTSYHLHLNSVNPLQNGVNSLQNGWNGQGSVSEAANATDPSKSYEIPPCTITPHHLREASNYLQIPNKLKPVGYQLGFKEHEIEGILYQNHNNVCQAAFTLLLDWNNQTGSDSDAWEKLFAALKQVIPVIQMEELHTKLMKS